MMKATVLKRGSRKKPVPSSNGGANASPAEPKVERQPHRTAPIEQKPAPEMMNPRRKQPTVEEISLTNKNYRLAKELVRKCVASKDCM